MKGFGLMVGVAGMVCVVLSGASWAEEGALRDKQVKTTHELEEIVVTATKTEREVKDISSNVTVITQEEIKKYQQVDLFDLLRHVPGLTISGLGSMRSKAVASFRGMLPDGRGLLLMLDGIEVNNVSNFFERHTIIPYNIERIEIIKNPASALYGVAGVGGIINVITKRPEKPVQAELSVSAGSFGTVEPHAYVGGRLENGFHFGVNTWYLQSDGYRHNTYTENFVANPRAGYTGKNIDFEMLANLKTVDDGYSGGLPLDTFRKNPTGSSQPDEFGKGHADINAVGAKLKWALGDNSLLRLKASYRTLDGSSDDVGLHFKFGFSETWTAESNYQYDFSICGVKSSLLTGVEYRYLDHSVYVRPNDYFYQFVQFANKANVNEDIWGLYIQDEVSPIENLMINVGVRYDIMGTDYKHSNSANSYDTSHDKLSPRAGFSYVFDPSLNLFGNYSQGIRSLFLTVAPFDLDRNVEPETLETWEVGFRGELPACFGITYNIAGFYILTEDKIVLVDPTNYIYQNAGETRSMGLEAGVGKKLPWGFYVALDYTYIDAEFTDYRTTTADYSGKRVPLVPRHQFGTTVGWVSEKYGRFDTSVRYGTDRFIDVANTLRLDGFTVVDLKYTYGFRDWCKGLELSFAINNLTDKTYAEHGSTSGGFYLPGPIANPADGRAFIGTATYRF